MRDSEYPNRVDPWKGNNPKVIERGHGLAPVVTFTPYRPLQLGEARMDKAGYVNVRLDDGKQHAEHRLVMVKMLGRPLRKGESVHHKNVRHDNREENLELWVGAVRYGQRATDLTCATCGESYAQAEGITFEPLKTDALFWDAIRRNQRKRLWQIARS